MLAWLILLVVVAAEAGGVVWWLRKEFMPVMFNGWAATIYSAAFAFDVLVAWFIAQLTTVGGSTGLQLLLILAVAVLVIVVLMTFFFKWVISHDMTDIPK